MRLDPQFKIEKACSSDKSRPVLTSAYLDVNVSSGAPVGRVVATDSYVMAVVPCEVEEGDVSGLIPSAAFAAARKASPRGEYARVSANGAAVVEGAGGSQSFPRPDGQFPNWRQLMRADDPNHGFTADAPSARFGVNVKELAKLAEALGSETVEIEVWDPLRPLYVRPVGRGARDDARGIAMPFRLLS